MNIENKEKMLNLLADKAVFGLSAAEAAELEKLRIEFPEFSDDSFEFAAAAINLTNLETEESLPAHLQAKILDDAESFFAPAEVEKKQNVYNFERKSKRLMTVETGRSAAETTSQAAWWQWLGWGIAAAACLALAINLWLTRFQPENNVVCNPVINQTPTPELTATQKREQLLASAKDVLQTSWTGANPKDPAQISGDIVWSNAEQKGFLRFRGLPVNDAAKETYQLWIFDENQSEKYPIDGGVFDAAETGEIIVPINAKITVKKPKMFAVTREKAGGVVVSDRQKMVAIAKI